MSKKLVVCDIDDVIAANAEGFIAWCNTQFGTNLTAQDYTEDFRVLWPDAEPAEVERRAQMFHESGAIAAYGHVPEGEAALRVLNANYRFIAATSRRKIGEPYTRRWLEQTYDGIFEDVIFAEIYNNIKPGSSGFHLRSKAEIYQKLQPDYVIDDQMKHCLAACKLGIKTIEFGNYSWTQRKGLPVNITWCKDWAAVLEYFDGIG